RMPSTRLILMSGIALVLAAAVSSAQTPAAIRTDVAAIGAPRSIVGADFNRDGYEDIALGGTARASIGILLSHGVEDGDEGQRFQPVEEIVVGGGPFELAAADLNRDGLIDIAVANADSNALTLLFNNGRDPFTAAGKV